jgi:hypothetical protein
MTADTSRARTPLADCLACHGTGVVHAKVRGAPIGLRSRECECWRLRAQQAEPTTIRCEGLMLGNTDLEPQA